MSAEHIVLGCARCNIFALYETTGATASTGNRVSVNVGDLTNSGAIAAASGLKLLASTIKSNGNFYAASNLNLNATTLTAQPKSPNHSRTSLRERLREGSAAGLL